MAKLNLRAVENRIAPLGGRESYDFDFIFELLEAYGRSKSSITRLRTGSLNVSEDKEREVAQKNVVYFRESDLGHALEDLDYLATAAHVTRYTPRFIIATDFNELVALDTKSRESLATPIREIDRHFTFFLPWAGMEKAQYVAESHADVRAAEKMGKLFDELSKANPELVKGIAGRHNLNVFFTRLLFCFFAEDTRIFAENQFTNAVGSQTLDDGTDTQQFLGELFKALDTPAVEDKPTHLRDFPYVNGRLFSSRAGMEVPIFTKAARQQLISLGTLIWQDINPDIFGSMFQAVVSPGQRSNLGQHYTSVPNILKTIDPLFMDELKEEFGAAYNSTSKLQRLYDRIAEIKVFDPACGSGNFLVIAYKELRRLEHAILERLADLDQKHNTLWTDSRISIENFYGIEIDDFAVEVAVLSMWIAKHQMNEEFKDKFGVAIPLIPLRETGQILSGNAARVDWNEICPNSGTNEIYLIGNPPYVGSSMQTVDQKLDFSAVFGDRPYSKKQDYISLWFVKGSDYIRGTNAELAFVSTNSVSQGDHVALLFPTVLARGIEISFAYPSFKWENNAKRKAGVTVVVIGLRNKNDRPKYIYTDDIRFPVENINAYLSNSPDVIVKSRRQPMINNLPPMTFGSKATDGGFLIIEPHELKQFDLNGAAIVDVVKKFTGSQEFINGQDRYCLWIEKSQLDLVKKDSEIARRLQGVSITRANSKKASTQKLATVPYRFGEVRYRPTDSIIVPSISSGRREYIPIGFLGPDTVISNKGFAIYDAEPWLFAILTSRMHMVWTGAVGGRMREDYQYSNTIVYNNFPVPYLTEGIKAELTRFALRVLDVREYHSERTLAELYDPDKMPDNLRTAHEEVDACVDKLYSARPFDSDDDRLSELFDRYKAVIEAEAGAKK